MIHPNSYYLLQM